MTPSPKIHKENLKYLVKCNKTLPTLVEVENRKNQKCS